MKFTRFVLMITVVVGVAAWAQHEHHAAQNVSPAKLAVSNDAERRLLVVTLGPLDLPAHTDHAAMSQPAPQILEIPFEGWITAYHPSLTDEHGSQLPTGILHHVAFWNISRADFLCPSKPEHIFGAGGEMNDWPALPGFGYRVHKGDRIRVTGMFHNPTTQSYAAAWLQVTMEYQPETAGLKSVYPAWFDVEKCGTSTFYLPPAGISLQAQIPLSFSGRLLGVGGHMHDYGERLVLVDATQKKPIATLDARVDDDGHILSMPVSVFVDRGGFPLKKGDEILVQAKYAKPRVANPEAMAIVVGYFLPDNDAEMDRLARK